MLYILLIFVSNSVVISCIEMLPELRLNTASQAVDNPCRCDMKVKPLVAKKLTYIHPEDIKPIEVDSVLHMVARPTPEPMETLEAILLNFLYGRRKDGEQEIDADTILTNERDLKNYSQFPSGYLMHSELFLKKSSVHLPSPELLHTGHCRLRLTSDYMQTAVDAFAIILEGALEDVRALPSDYVLQSARTISIMKIPYEKLSAMWDAVLNGRHPNSIDYQTLEMYRPLFKYLSGKQMARLNLSDSRIINYIGTHPDLTRHQVGVVASKYIKVNPNWRHIKYLNNMNNLLCGVPMTFMRKIGGAEYLSLEHQVFYHIRACDPLQKRFYLNMMTKTHALGKSFSWSARDVSRLGLLLPEVEGSALASISPEAMAGISSHVMAEMKPENLKHLTELQVKYIKTKAKNIMSRKLKQYDALMVDTACKLATNIFLNLLLVLHSIIIINK